MGLYDDDDTAQVRLLTVRFGYRINTKYWAAASIGPGPATPTNPS